MDILQLLRIGLFFGGFGLVVGFGLAQLFKSSKKPSSQRREKPIQAPTDQFEILRVSQHNDTSKMLVDMRGRPLPSGPNLSAEQIDQVETVLLAVYKWMGKQPQIAGAGAAPQPEADPPAETRKTSEFSDSLPPIPQVADVLVNPFKRPDFGTTTPKGPSKSVVEQINDIFQAKIEGSALEKLKIQLKEIPGKGMIIHIGVHKFENIDDIPDAKIRGLIRASANEWNSQQRDNLHRGGRR